MHLLSQIICSCKTLYMFRTVFPSIIRSLPALTDVAVNSVPSSVEAAFENTGYPWIYWITGTEQQTRGSYSVTEFGGGVATLSWKKVYSYFSIVQPTRRTSYLKLFVLLKRSTCFGRSFRPSSGAQNCVYSNGICQTAAAGSSSCLTYIVAVYAVLSSWWWTEKPPETCTAFYKNK